MTADIDPTTFPRRCGGSCIPIVIAYCLVLMLPALADPHEPGWLNAKKNAAGEWCCGEGDCLEVEPVRATENGYLVMVTGETVPYSEVQPSQDGKFWRCKRPDGTRRCFFAPPPSI